MFTSDNQVFSGYASNAKSTLVDCVIGLNCPIPSLGLSEKILIHCR